MIQEVTTAWLYAYSSNPSEPSKAQHTVFTGGEGSNGRELIAQTSLSYLTTLNQQGAGALVKSYTPPFGPPVTFSDFKFNSVYAPNAIAVTFGLSATGAEAYSLGTIFFL